MKITIDLDESTVTALKQMMEFFHATCFKMFVTNILKWTLLDFNNKNYTLTDQSNTFVYPHFMFDGK